VRAPVCQYDFRNADLRSHGCTVASLTYSAREMGADVEDVEDYTGRLQRLSGVPLDTFRERGTTMTEAKVAYEMAPGFGGRVPPRFRLLRGGSVRDDLLPALEEGRIAVVAVNYGIVQDAGKGVGSFRGGHAVVVGEPEPGKVTVADPLRRELVQWRVGLLETAMERFGKIPWLNGRGEFGIVLPSPTWLEVRTRQLAEAKARLSAAVVEREALRARVAALEAAAPDCTGVEGERDRLALQVATLQSRIAMGVTLIGGNIQAAQAALAALSGEEQQ
jgi:hypothetical protein